MSKIKLRDKDIKFRSREIVSTKVFRRINIKALAKNAKPTVQEEQSTEAKAVDTGTEATAATMQKMSVIRRNVNRFRKQRKNQKNIAAKTPEPPPVFSSIRQKDHPDIHIEPQSPMKTPQKAASIPHITAKTLSVDKPDIKSATAIQPKEARISIKNSKNVRTPSIHPSAKRIHQSKAAAAQAAAAKKLSKTEKIKDILKSVVQKMGKGIVSKLPMFGSAAGVLALVLIVILIGALICSPMGIFFSGESEGDMTLQQVVGQLNREFSDDITEIENTVAHDDLEQIGQRAKWKDILSVYAVKVSTDPENPLEVMTMDEERAVLLSEIFWDMNSIDYTTEIYTEEITVEIPTDDSTDEDGMVEENQTMERIRLIITISGKTAQQMAEEYEFNQEQLSLMTELLSEEYEELWYGLPYGGGSDDIVEVALSQVGNVGGEPYWRWYGYSSRVAWCACFVSWCGEQCGYIESGIMSKFSYCPTGVQWFRSQGQWADRSATPEPGWIIFFDWDYDSISDHVGIVEYSDGGMVYTIEGNANDTCRRLAYTAGIRKILGYGII